MMPFDSLTRCHNELLSLRRLIHVTVMTLVSIAAFTSPLTVSAQDETNWRTGRELDQFNQLAISAWWSDATLRNRMRDFSRNQRIGIFIDRRLDPSLPIEVSLEDVTKEQFLWQVGEKHNFGVTRIEDFYYLGPKHDISVLPELIARTRKQTLKLRKSSQVDWNSRATLNSDQPVEPRNLILKLADENGFQVENMDAIPHDLWAPFSLPKTTLQSRLTVLLIGFGKTFERSADGRLVTIVDLPRIDSREATFRDIENPTVLAEQLRARVPNAKIVVRGKRLVASGRPGDVAQVEREIIAAQVAQGIESGEKTFTITTRATRGAVLQTVAQLSNSTLSFDKRDSAIVNTLNEQVEIRAVKASLDELLRQALDGTPLKCDLDRGELRISEK